MEGRWKEMFEEIKKLNELLAQLIELTLQIGTLATLIKYTLLEIKEAVDKLLKSDKK